jgi:hypothetical protein
MIKDILGQILDMKKQGNIVVKIELEPSAVEKDEDTEMKVQGLAPAPGDKKDEQAEDESNETMLPEDLMGEDEMHNMKRKKKQGMSPKSLSERVKMDAIEE